MQEKSVITRKYLNRFDAYCVQSGIKVAEACRVIGISRSLLYALRAGKRQVTEKMEKRLSIAEREAVVAARINEHIAWLKKLEPRDFEDPAAHEKTARKFWREISKCADELKKTTGPDDLGMATFITALIDHPGVEDFTKRSVLQDRLCQQEHAWLEFYQKFMTLNELLGAVEFVGDSDSKTKVIHARDEALGAFRSFNRRMHRLLDEIRDQNEREER